MEAFAPSQNTVPEALIELQVAALCLISDT